MSIALLVVVLGTVAVAFFTLAFGTISHGHR
jgi:hypothetical protein